MSGIMFPWGSQMHSGPRKKWMDERGLWKQFKDLKAEAMMVVATPKEADLIACRKIVEIANGMEEPDEAAEALPTLEATPAEEGPVRVDKGGHLRPREEIDGEFAADMVDRPPCREDYIWAATSYADRTVKKEMAPSRFAWSLLVGARQDPSAWRNLQDKVGKGIFGGEESDDDDDRAFTASGLPQALRDRFRGLRDEARQLLSGELPRVFGRTA